MTLFMHVLQNTSNKCMFEVLYYMKVVDTSAEILFHDYTCLLADLPGDQTYVVLRRQGCNNRHHSHQHHHVAW